jgi:hypothetical protein
MSGTKELKVPMLTLTNYSAWKQKLRAHLRVKHFKPVNVFTKVMKLGEYGESAGQRVLPHQNRVSDYDP